jgi:hypothetical protein
MPVNPKKPGHGEPLHDCFFLCEGDPTRPIHGPFQAKMAEKAYEICGKAS